MLSQDTAIEWTDRTWNPVRGCSRVSEGCRNCYAELLFLTLCIGGVALRAACTAGKLQDAMERIAQLEAIITADITHEDITADLDRGYWPDDEEDA